MLQKLAITADENTLFYCYSPPTRGSLHGYALDGVHEDVNLISFFIKSHKQLSLMIAQGVLSNKSIVLVIYFGTRFRVYDISATPRPNQVTLTLYQSVRLPQNLPIDIDNMYLLWQVAVFVV